MSGRRRVGAAGHGDVIASLVLIAPLWFAYDLALLIAPSANGADLVSGPLWSLAGARAAPYLLLHAGLAAAFLVWARRSGRARSLQLGVVGPVVAEAAIIALCLGGLVTLIVHDALGLAAGSAGADAVVALGAGVHEELVFRLGAFLGGVWLLRRAGWSPRAAWAVALLASSLLFAAAHHVGPGHEPWSADAFAFRAFAGAAFACVCWWRSLAHAVYAHVLYDLYIAVIS